MTVGGAGEGWARAAEASRPVASSASNPASEPPRAAPWISCRPRLVTALQQLGVRRVAAVGERSTVLKERRDIDLVVADLERGALVVVHRDVPVAPRPTGR